MNNYSFCILLGVLSINLYAFANNAFILLQSLEVACPNFKEQMKPICDKSKVMFNYIYYYFRKIL